MNGLVLGCLWVIVAALVAILPMRWQILPGLALLAAAPLLLWRIGSEFGWLAAGLCALAVVSVFRRPLIVLFRRASSRGAPEPKGGRS